MKKILFVHNNFPAQFVHVAQFLARDPAYELAAIGTQTARRLPGVKLVKYSVTDPDVATTHPFARRFDLECRRAEEVLYAASSLSSAGFLPDLVLVHPGWGEALPLRATFPNAQHVTYCEFFYRTQGQDSGFDPEFAQGSIDGGINLHSKNAATLLALVDCDRAISPTQWQRSTFPREFQPKIQVIHEGVDTDKAKPSSHARLQLPSGRVLTKSDEVVTFAARHFEPVRGFHIFMRALPRILAARPQAQIVLIGGDGNPYGAVPARGDTWKNILLREIAGRVDMTRIHFTGHLSHAEFLHALQISSAHVYLTYPFVLSWSLLEAMSAGCLVIGSATSPVEEVLNAENGFVIPFFDVDQLADRVINALSHPRRYKTLRTRARATIVNAYDTKRVCLPRLLDFLGLETGSDMEGYSGERSASLDEVM